MNGDCRLQIAFWISNLIAVSRSSWMLKKLVVGAHQREWEILSVDSETESDFGDQHFVKAHDPAVISALKRPECNNVFHQIWPLLRTVVVIERHPVMRERESSVQCSLASFTFRKRALLPCSDSCDFEYAVKKIDCFCDRIIYVRTRIWHPATHVPFYCFQMLTPIYYYIRRVLPSSGISSSISLTNAHPHRFESRNT